MANWYDNVPVPVDANGREVPLDTRELVLDGKRSGVMCYLYGPATRKWYVEFADGGERRHLSACAMPDSWERLEWDAAFGSCHYFGMDRAEVCDGCPTKSNVDNLHVCYGAMTRDILRRAKALAGVADGE